jgi:hypothetical protein
MLAAAAALSGCAAESPTLNSFADDRERADAGRIIERAFTEPMSKLAQQAQSGNDRDRLAYADALAFGRAPDSPGTALSDVVPYNEVDVPLPTGRDELFVAASLGKRRELDQWTNNVALRIWACTTTCDVHRAEPTPAPSDTAPATSSLYERYVISNNWRCVGEIAGNYRRALVIDILSKEVANTSGKRRALAYHLFGQFRLTAVLQGVGIYDCDRNYEKYMTLYGADNDQLRHALTAYLDQELDEKEAIPNF